MNTKMGIILAMVLALGAMGSAPAYAANNPSDKSLSEVDQNITLAALTKTKKVVVKQDGKVKATHIKAKKVGYKKKY